MTQLRSVEQWLTNALAAYIGKDQFSCSGPRGFEPPSLAYPHRQSDIAIILPFGARVSTGPYELKIPLSHLEFIEPRSKVGSVWDIVPTLRTQSVCTNRQLIQLLFQLIE